MMDSRAARLEAALRAEDALIVGAQMEVERYLTKQFEASELVDRLIRILDGPEQREAQRLAREALGEDFGNNA
jgi:DNA-binding response OmpR family regulator